MVSPSESSGAGLDGPDARRPGSEAPGERLVTGADVVVDDRVFDLVSAFVDESYNTGWSIRAHLAFDTGAEPAAVVDTLATLAAHGLVAGVSAVVRVVNREVMDTDAGRRLPTEVLRRWPCIVTGLSPGVHDARTVLCRIDLCDPVSYLAPRAVWGAFSRIGPAQLVGGAISLAAGGDGRPCDEVVVPYLPRIVVRSRCRASLDRIEYAVACGESLGTWLASVLGALGLRAEMFDEEDGAVLVVSLLDAAVYRTSFSMAVVDADTPYAGDAPDGPLTVRSRTLFPALPVRGALLDDPTQGTPHAVLAPGAPSRVIDAASIDVAEATERAMHAVRASRCESIVLWVSSLNPGWAHGTSVVLDRSQLGITEWQIASVRHLVHEGRYDNDATLLRADVAWHPPAQPPRGAMMVSALVDHAPHLLSNEPVPRDRLGRVRVRFVFSALDVPSEDASADAPGTDGPSSPDDRSDVEQAGYDARREHWEGVAAAFARGEYDDEDPDRSDSELSESGLAERVRRSGLRAAALAYLRYRSLSETAGEDGDGAGEHPRPTAADPTDEVPNSWPPRIALPVLSPMAGALHGLVASYRQGDVCRVAVHGPFSAEIVGAQYRGDRLVHEDLVGASTGLVAEHDFGGGWSGLVFSHRDSDSSDTS